MKVKPHGEAGVRSLFVGIDPGSSKCGYAAVYDDWERAALEVVPTGELGERIDTDVRKGRVCVICVGNATRSHVIAAMCRSRWPAVELAIVDETNTTFEARRLYYDDHPPRGLMRLVPRGLLVPKEPLDAYAALLIIRRYRGVVPQGRKGP